MTDDEQRLVTDLVAQVDHWQGKYLELAQYHNGVARLLALSTAEAAPAVAKLARIRFIATSAHAVIGNYVNSRLALEAVIVALDGEPDDWDEYVL